MGIQLHPRKNLLLVSNWFENKISTDATFITTFDKTVEQNETIYPTAVADADDKFILRLAYDENALFDSRL